MKKETSTRLRSYSITGFTPQGWDFLMAAFLAKNPDLTSDTIWGRPPALDPDDSMLVTVISYRRNYTEQELADMFTVSQSTINRTIHKYSHLICDSFPHGLASLEQIKNQINEEKILEEKILLDGTHITTSKHGYDPLLYSGKHKTCGFNVQILASLTGELLYVSGPLPGSMHDSKALAITKITDYINPEHIIADKGYIGTRIITPLRKNSKEMTNNPEKTRENNTRITRLRYPVERAIAHLKNWKILATRYRKKLTDFPHHLTTITTLEHLKKTFA